jgi:hypothetical protein
MEVQMVQIPSAIAGTANILPAFKPAAAAAALIPVTPSELKSIISKTASAADLSAVSQALKVPRSTFAGREKAASTVEEGGMLRRESVVFLGKPR